MQAQNKNASVLLNLLSQISNNTVLKKNISINAQQFIDYYESNGWKVGRNSMKDWQATVRRWASNNYGKKKNSKDNAINVVKEVMEEYRNEQQGNDSSITIDVTDSVVY